MLLNAYTLKRYSNIGVVGGIYLGIHNCTLWACTWTCYIISVGYSLKGRTQCQWGWWVQVILFRFRETCWLGWNIWNHVSGKKRTTLINIVDEPCIVNACFKREAWCVVKIIGVNQGLSINFSSQHNRGNAGKNSMNSFLGVRAM